MRDLVPLIVVIAQLSRAAPSQAAESSQHLDTPLERAEQQRAVDARVTVASSHTSLHLYTAGDLLARSTALGYAVAALFTDGGRDAGCNLHDGACSDAAGGIAFGVELYGALGDSTASLDPRAQPHLVAVVATFSLGADVMLHAQLARAMLEEETVGQLLLAAEF